jgi:hypothetical protein
MNLIAKFMLRGPPCAITGFPEATSEVFGICPKFPPLADAQVFPTIESQVVNVLFGK